MAVGSALPETSLVLDTNILSEWRAKKLYVQDAIIHYIARLKRPPALASVNIFEALHGFEKALVKFSQNEEQISRDRTEVEKLIEYCTVLPFDEKAAEIAAYAYPRLSQSDRNKHWCDLFIAATALAHGHGIATGNRKDFELIARHLPASHQLLRLAIWKP